MRKFASYALSLILATLVIFSPNFTPDIFATATMPATFCFDKDSSLDYWHPIEIAGKTPLSYEISDYSFSGSGALLISKDTPEYICDDNNSAGIYITADDFGLEDFGGCYVQMRILIDFGLSNHCDDISIFSDGENYISQKFSTITEKHWSIISLKIPEDTKNNNIGISIPNLGDYTGNIISIDDLTIFNSDEKNIANVGDASSDIIKSSSNYSLSMIYTNLFILAISLVLITTLIFLITQKYNEKHRRLQVDENKTNQT